GAIDDGQERLSVRHVAGPQLAADRLPVTGEHGSDDHLLEIGAMVLPMAVLAETLATGAFEVEARGIEGGERGLGEEVAAAGEELLLDRVLGLAQPAHGSIELVQLDLLAAGNAHVTTPAIRSSIRAGFEQAVQHGEVDRAFDIEGEVATQKHTGQDA